MTACPYCKQPLNGRIALPVMSIRQRIIYDAVVAAGNDGIRTAKLVSMINSTGSGGGVVLRVQIHELNKKLRATKQRIKGAGGSYWLINT